MSDRPACITRWDSKLTPDTSSYPGSKELLSFGANFTEDMGLSRLGVWCDVLKPGRRSSWPHAHEKIEEIIYVLEGTPQVWINGYVHDLTPGDVVGFPAGTGIAHCFLNNSDADVRLLVMGDHTDDDRIVYPLHSARNEEMKAKGFFWDDMPTHELGPHDGLPDALRGQEG